MSNSGECHFEDTAWNTLKPQLFNGSMDLHCSLGFCKSHCPTRLKSLECAHVCKGTKALIYLVFAKHISLGNAEQQGIGNLPSSTSHQNSDWLSLQDTKLSVQGGTKKKSRFNCSEHMVKVYWCQEDLLKQGSVKYRLFLPYKHQCCVTKTARFCGYFTSEAAI